MNIESREKLIEIIKLARGSMSQRAFGKLLGVSATAVQLWEKGVNVPDTEYLAKIAARAGYTLQELLSCLDGKPIQETSDLSLILRQIQHMPLSQVAQIVQAAADRFAAVAEASGDEASAS
ncbi:DNA-binding protein [Nostoc linckia z18]|uniref:DNA-binding protein n=3 Tax=Nostoc TaxID=1177 RepID=A0A9Q6EMC5_NOSLI|nr:MULTISPECIES: helix-turn-helix transcriptional regulator [Nostoc]MBL1200533.1 helix-turn-helix transcriptional regulator [Nostoc sp. GBBB01]MDZ8013419.1 helix-turn-helix transcriptional regulator [Nostoc sp. ZfuVER08]PHK38924.1 DNA-binding protein [Nostoc linckia z15]PHK47781.1 DNA-binding protein [Nostoc linckia z16]MBC1237424.1 helix-turn-helix transcriptional regulator [Nostoc sp. 2RC]